MLDSGHQRGNINARGYINVSLNFTVERMYFSIKIILFIYNIEKKYEKVCITIFLLFVNHVRFPHKNVAKSVLRDLFHPYPTTFK